MQTIVHIKSKVITNPKVVRKFFEGLEDGRHLITAKSLRKRSIPQNSYQHVLFTMLVEPLRDAGWDRVKTMQDAKDFVKKLFLTVKERNDKTGEVFEFVKRTRDLTKEETNIFIAEIHQWAAEYLNTVLPDPGEQVSILFASFDNELNATIVE